jgi:hypothetical protein
MMEPKFARYVFIGAGLWGMAVLLPLYFSTASIGGQHPSPTSDPLFYYGFLAVTLAWQFAFLVIGSDPIRFRPLMVPAMLEKFIYIVSVAVLWTRERLPASDVVVTTPDLVLGVLFVMAFLRTPKRGQNWV